MRTDSLTFIHQSILHLALLTEAKPLHIPVCWGAKIGPSNYTQMALYWPQHRCPGVGRGESFNGDHCEERLGLPHSGHRWFQQTMDPLQDTDEPRRQDGSTLGKTYLRKGTHCKAVTSTMLGMWAAKRSWE